MFVYDRVSAAQKEGVCLYTTGLVQLRSRVYVCIRQG